MQLQGKIVIVTGAGSGIGRATAQLFAKEGARLGLFDQDAAALDKLTQEIGAAGGEAIIGVGDVADAATVETAVAQVAARWGRIDGIVTAAGVSVGKALLETTEEEWDRVFAVNVRGTFLVLKAVLPHMLSAGRGSIVTIASQLARAGGRGSCSYIASKGAVISLTRSVALDYADRGIRANAILPGAVETPMLARSFARHADPQAAREAAWRRHPLGRFGKVDEIAQAALYLISDASSFTTGIEMPVDGGWLVG
jgi:2-keto-3-deoxy-L-fuconate dehydrogenase